MAPLAHAISYDIIYDCAFDIALHSASSMSFPISFPSYFHISSSCSIAITISVASAWPSYVGSNSSFAIHFPSANACHCDMSFHIVLHITCAMHNACDSISLAIALSRAIFKGAPPPEKE